MNIVVCGNYGVTNVGDEAILQGMRRVLDTAFPGSHIQVMGTGNVLPLGLRSFLKALAAGRMPHGIKMIRECDLFILGGGGLFCDEEGPFVSAFWALHGLMAKFLGKKLAVLGISIGKLTRYNAPFVRRLFKRADLVIVRDEFSANILDSWNVKNHVCADFATLGLDQDTPCRTNKDKYVVISIRPFGINANELYKKIALLCDRIVHEYGFNIVFLPMSAIGQNDTGVLNKIFDLMTHQSKAHVEDFSPDLGSVISILANAECVVGMRLHSCILASMYGVPVIPLSYMSKVANYWSRASDVMTFDLESHGADDILKRFREIVHTGKNTPSGHDSSIGDIVRIVSSL